MAKVFGVSAIPLTISEVVDYLKDPPAIQFLQWNPRRVKCTYFKVQELRKVNAL